MHDFGSEKTDSKPVYRFRFSTVHLLYLVAVIAAALALFDMFAFVWVLAVLFFWQLAYGWAAKGVTLIELLVILFILLCFSCMSMPDAISVREASRRISCANNVRQLNLALLNYQSAKLRFPPAYKADKDGEPMHSWRVMIAPELEMQNFSAQYDFSEAWDGPGNRKLVDQISPVYSCPVKKLDNFVTPYKVVTGNGTAFDADQAAKVFQFQSLGNTIAIIEDSSDPVSWMAPKDLTIEQAVKLFDKEYVQSHPEHVVETKFSRHVYYHRHIGLFDGNVLHVGCLEDPQQIIPYLMLNHPDKKNISDLEFVYPDSAHSVLYRGYFLVAVNITLALLPCFVARLRPFEKENE